MNTRYGKIIDGVFEYAPTNLEVDLTIYKPAPDYILEEAGYKRIETTPYPDSRDIYVSHWEEREDKIVQVWALERVLTPAEKRELAYQEDRICEYMGELYTCDELEALAMKYMFEATDTARDKVAAMSLVLTDAKERIRALYPDEVIA